MIGNEPYRLATARSPAERCRCCHSGVLEPGRRRGSSRARAAFSRKRAANIADVPNRPTTRSSTSSAEGKSDSRIDSPPLPHALPAPPASPSGKRIAMPSSDQIVWTP